jgi:hypothetical protein
MKLLTKLITILSAAALWAVPAVAGRSQLPTPITANDTIVAEGTPYVTVVVTRSGNLKKPSAFNYTTVDGTAKAGQDYTSMSGSLSFGSGRSTATLSVPIIQDSTYEGNETFKIQLTPTNNATCGTICTPVITIVDDDPVPVTPPPTKTCPDGSVILTTDTCSNPTPPPPPPPTTQVCPDGSVIPITSTCTNPTPPPPTTKTCSDGSVIPVDQDCPVIANTQTTTVSPDLTGITPIASEFDYHTSIEAGPIPGDNTGDTLSAFRFVCGAGQLKYDDPLRAFNQPGKSHLHQFYGNLDASATSTYATLRAHGNSTCGDPTKNPANRSAYWAPALLDGAGHVIQPDMNVVYYKRYPKNSTQCNDTRITLGCVALPFGLRYIFGRDLANLSTTSAATSHFHWYCDNNTGTFTDIKSAMAVCSAGHHLVVNIDAPVCWNGTQLDSANHMSHMAYMVDTHLGFPGCPATHPYVIPEFALNIYYSVLAGDNGTNWQLSSDSMAPTEPHGSTFHADWFGAWDPTVMAMWSDNCLDKHLNCNSGILGNGYQMIGAYQPSYGQTNPNRLVAIPVNPNP